MQKKKGRERERKKSVPVLSLLINAQQTENTTPNAAKTITS